MYGIVFVDEQEFICDDFLAIDGLFYNTIRKNLTQYLKTTYSKTLGSQFLCDRNYKDNSAIDEYIVCVFPKKILSIATEIKFECNFPLINDEVLENGIHIRHYKKATVLLNDDADEDHTNEDHTKFDVISDEQLPIENIESESKNSTDKMHVILDESLPEELLPEKHVDENKTELNPNATATEVDFSAVVHVGIGERTPSAELAVTNNLPIMQLTAPQTDQDTSLTISGNSIFLNNVSVNGTTNIKVLKTSTLDVEDSILLKLLIHLDKLFVKLWKKFVTLLRINQQH